MYVKFSGDRWATPGQVQSVGALNRPSQSGPSLLAYDAAERFLGFFLMNGRKAVTVILSHRHPSGVAESRQGNEFSPTHLRVMLS